MDVNFPENCERFGVELGEVTTLRGATFTPSVSDDGVISWANDHNLPNPAPVNIKGEKGAQGERGLQGVPGADGKTPVKGKDYWTEADKAEMVEGVLAALPTWTGGSY